MKKNIRRGVGGWEREKETDRETERQRDRKTETETAKAGRGTVKRDNLFPSADATHRN